MEYTDKSVIISLKSLGHKTGLNLLRQLIDTYIATTPGSLETMKKLLNDKNYSSLARNANSFKSSCGNLGINEMYRICDQIESQITSRSCTHDDLREMVFRLYSLQENVLEELRSLQASH